jgi:hypothetical protein
MADNKNNPLKTPLTGGQSFVGFTSWLCLKAIPFAMFVASWPASYYGLVNLFSLYMAGTAASLLALPAMLIAVPLTMFIYYKTISAVLRGFFRGIRNTFFRLCARFVPSWQTSNEVFYGQQNNWKTLGLGLLALLTGGLSAIAYKVLKWAGVFTAKRNKNLIPDENPLSKEQIDLLKVVKTVKRTEDGVYGWPRRLYRVCGFRSFCGFFNSEKEDVAKLFDNALRAFHKGEPQGGYAAFKSSAFFKSAVVAAKQTAYWNQSCVDEVVQKAGLNLDSL